jgi:hypothetical protein
VEGIGQPSNKTCNFRNNKPNVVTFYGDQQVTENSVDFPPGTELVGSMIFIRMDAASSITDAWRFVLVAGGALSGHRQIRFRRVGPPALQSRQVDRHGAAVFRPEPGK